MDYFNERKQFVRIGTIYSKLADVTSGVPQGSVIGPFLYSVATSSFVVDSRNCHLVKYADDTTLCLPLLKNNDNSHILRAHENLIAWSNSMSLSINSRKSKCLSICKRFSSSAFRIPGIQSVETLCILGVTFNARGTWSTHVDNIIRCTSRRFYILRTLRPLISDNNLKMAYFGLMRSLIEYCCPVFVGLSLSDSHRLEMIQRRFHKLLCGRHCSCEALPSLKGRRQSQSLKLLNCIMSDDQHVLRCLLPRVSPSGRFLLPVSHTERRSRAFIRYMCSFYNSYCKR